MRFTSRAVSRKSDCSSWPGVLLLLLLRVVVVVAVAVAVQGDGVPAALLARPAEAATAAARDQAEAPRGERELCRHLSRFPSERVWWLP